MGPKVIPVPSVRHLRLRHALGADGCDCGPRVGMNARNFEPDQLGTVRIRRLECAVTETYLDYGKARSRVGSPVRAASLTVPNSPCSAR